jgi:ABC-2 type transport system ATP-binding protein
VAREEEQERAEPGSDQHRPRIVSIKVAGAESDAMAIVGSGEAFDVDFVYELPDDAAAPLALGVGVESAGGQYLFATNTKMFDLAIPGTAGTHVVRLSYPQGQPLGAGEFVLRGLLEHVDGTPLDRMNPASTFSSLEPPIGSGAVRVDARMTVGE